MIKALDKKEIDKKLEKIYGMKLPRGQIIQQSKEKLRIFTGDVSEKELNFLSSIVNVEVIGLYFAFQKEKEFRLSFDALFLADEATKNILELDDKQFKEWIAGGEIDIDTNNIKHGEDDSEDSDQSAKKSDNEYIFLKYHDNVVGCGKVTENRVLNFVPKERRLLKL
ncbi:MAG: hypothetical protein NTX24_01630 [Candidatus Pacearchaeota archaeon]|nr:hypothetical protein [Candidatus Pacearchaeota archaeon]